MKNKEMIDIIEKSEKIEFVEKVHKDIKFYYWSGLNSKHYLIYEAQSDNLEDTLKIVERICLEDDEIKKIRPQFIYTIILKEFKNIEEQFYKDIIEIEENEYFCKKYVLYYENKEIEALKKWMADENTDSFSDLLNTDSCVENMDMTDEKEQKWAVNLLLKIIIKCPFIKYSFEKENLSDFGLELEKLLKGVRKKEIDKEVMNKYKRDFYDKLDENNIDDMVDSFIQSVGKELK